MQQEDRPIYSDAPRIPVTGTRVPTVVERTGTIPEEQVERDTRGVVPVVPPLYYDSQGRPSYDNNQSWWDSFTDRRLYAQTGGGAGYWLTGLKTPTRAMYESTGIFPSIFGADFTGIGDLEGNEVDAGWVEQKKIEGWVDRRTQSLKEGLGDRLFFIEREFGPNAIRDIVSSAVSNDNEVAKLTYVMDVAETKARIEDYDASSGWATYLATKTSSALANYAAVDPVTNISTIASLGVGTAIPAMARSAALAEKLPWLSHGTNLIRSWQMTNAPTIAKAHWGLNAVDGTISGYGFYRGYNADQADLFGDNAVLDENPVDDIAIGLGLGVTGGWVSYRMNIKQANRNAAIEALAMSGSIIPTRESADFALRFSVAQSNLLRYMKSIGIAETDDAFKIASDPNQLRQLGYRRPTDLFELTDQIDRTKPDADELKGIMSKRMIDENNQTVAFRKEFDDFFASKPDGYITVNGVSVPNTEKYGDELVRHLSGVNVNGRTVSGVLSKLKSRGAGISDNEIQLVYSLMGTRSGVSGFDLTRFLLTADEGEVIRTMQNLIRFSRETLDEEIATIRLHYPDIAQGLDNGSLSKPRNFRELEDFIDKEIKIGDEALNPTTTPRNIFSSSIEIQNPSNTAGRIRGSIAEFGRTERDITLRGTDLTNGHPLRRFLKFRDRDDTKLIKKINRNIRDAVKRGQITADEETLLKAELRNQAYRNDVLRSRYGRGVHGEELGFFNTNTVTDIDDPHLIDGAYPFAMRTKTYDDVGVPTVDANSARSSQYARMQDFRNRVNGMAARPRTADIETKYSQAGAARNIAGNNIGSLNGLRNLIRKVKLADPTKTSFTFGDLLNLGAVVVSDKTVRDASNKITKLRLSVDIDGVNYKFELEGTVLDELFESADLTKNIEDIRLKSNDYDTLAARFEKEELTAKQQYSRIRNQKKLGINIEDDDYHFAVANNIARALRNTPFIGKGLSTLTKLSMNNSIVGLRTSRLWFNADAPNQGGAFRQILMFANLIDSPHILRRDFGNIIDNQLFSVQQMRNFNAVQANKVVSKLKQFANEGRTFTGQDHKNVMVALRSGDPSSLSNDQKEIHDLVVEFLKEFEKDALDIVRKDLYGERALWRNLFFVPQRSTLLARRGEARGIISQIIDEDVQKNIGSILGVDPKLFRRDIAEPITTAFPDATIALSDAVNRSNTKDELIENLFRKDALDSEEYRGIKALLDDLTDADVVAMRTSDDLVTALETARTAQGRAYAEYLDSNATRLIDGIDPLNLKVSRNAKIPVMDAETFAGLKIRTDRLYGTIVDDERMADFFHSNIADLVVNFAHDQGLRIRFQSQMSRNFNNKSIFELMDENRKTVLAEVNRLRRSGVENLPEKNISDNLNTLEDHMGYALGFNLETNPRYGIGETAFRLQNGLIRAGAAGYWGLQTAVAEVPKAFALSVNRTGFVNAFVDLLTVIYNRTVNEARSDLDDIGAALEQYTRRFALGVDNEAYTGSIVMTNIPFTDAAKIGTRAVGPTFNANVNPMKPLSLAGQLIKGRQIDPFGVTRFAQEKGAGRGLRTLTGMLDASVNLVESVANASTRISGQQYFSAIGREVAVRSAKKTLVRQINLIERFAKDFKAANIQQLKSEAERIAAFKKLAEKHNVDWALMVRLNHHGLLDLQDITALKGAFKDKNVVNRSNKTYNFLADDYVSYDSQALRNYLDRASVPRRNLGRLSRGGFVQPGDRARSNTTDRLMTKLTAFLEEEANTAVAGATAIASNPNANIIQRFLGQFGNYTRGVQHQNFLRGANDSNMARIIAMAVPLIVGEMIYQEGKRIIEAKNYKGGKTSEETFNQMLRDWREQPELKVYEIISRIPTHGVMNSFIFNNVVNPFAGGVYDEQSNTFGKTTAHNLMYNTAASALGTENIITRNLDMKAPDFITPKATTTKPYMFGKSRAFWHHESLFKPYTDLYDSGAKLLYDNPYRNRSEVLFNFNEKFYSLVPGVHTWTFQSGLRLMGYNPIEEDPRASKY